MLKCVLFFPDYSYYCICSELCEKAINKALHFISFHLNSEKKILGGAKTINFLTKNFKYN